MHKNVEAGQKQALWWLRNKFRGGPFWSMWQEDIENELLRQTLLLEENIDDTKGNSWCRVCLIRKVLRFIRSEFVKHNDDVLREPYHARLYDDKVEQYSLQAQDAPSPFTALMVDEALGMVSKREADVLRLFYLEDCSSTEISERINLSSARIRQLRTSAIRDIRDVYGENTDSPVPTAPNHRAWHKGMCGASSGLAKLTWEQVRQMRCEYAVGDILQRELAAKYGITAGSVSTIVNGVTWREN